MPARPNNRPHIDAAPRRCQLPIRVCAKRNGSGTGPPNRFANNRDVLGYSIEGQTDDYFGSVLRGRVNFYIRKSDASFYAATYSIFVDEVDELCQSFQDRGATIVEQPEDKPWGYRQFTLEDLNGYCFHYFRFQTVWSNIALRIAPNSLTTSCLRTCVSCEDPRVTALPHPA